MDIPPTWKRFRDALLNAGTASVYIMGEPDNGKTSFRSYLHGSVENAGGRVSLIDCDPGQSTVGPPTTLGLLRPDGSTVLRFGGSTTPRGYLLQQARATVDLFRRADKNSVQLIDASGFMRGAAAEEYQYTMLDLLRPDFAVSLGTSRAVNRICGNFASAAGMEIHNLQVSRDARRKTPHERKSYRERKLAQYFDSAAEYSIDVRECGLNGRIPKLSSPEVRNRLLAVLNSEQLVIALAVAMDMCEDHRRMRVWGPPVTMGEAAAIQFGDADFRLPQPPAGL